MEYIDLPLKEITGGLRFYEVTFVEGRFYEEMFPQLDVPREFCKMAAWLHSNPTRRKTLRGTKRFIGNWLLRACAQQETPSRVRMESKVGAHQ